MKRIESRQITLLAAKAALAKYAEGVVVMDLRRLSSVTDFFVIANATSSRQLRAITEHIEAELSRIGHRVWHVEGIAAAKAIGPDHADDGFSWILMDYGDLIVHLFNPPAREFYQLERLWGDAPRISLDPNKL